MRGAAMPLAEGVRGCGSRRMPTRPRAAAAAPLRSIPEAGGRRYALPGPVGARAQTEGRFAQ